MLGARGGLLRLDGWRQQRRKRTENENCPEKGFEHNYLASASFAASFGTTDFSKSPLAIKPRSFARSNRKFHSRLKETWPLTCSTPLGEIIFVFASCIFCFSMV